MGSRRDGNRLMSIMPQMQTLENSRWEVGHVSQYACRICCGCILCTAIAANPPCLMLQGMSATLDALSMLPAQVTALLVLYALPWLLTGSILAHEASGRPSSSSCTHFQACTSMHTKGMAAPRSG